MSALEGRSQRAREAFEVEFGGADVLTADALDAAVREASRVRITPELARLAFAPGAPYGPIEKLRAVFEAAGFEVEQ